MTELALGEEVNWSRWLVRGEILTNGFLSSFGQYGIKAWQADDIWVLLHSGKQRAVILGHPLWRRDHAFLQRSVATEVESRFGFRASTSDLYELDRTPMRIARRLLQ